MNRLPPGPTRPLLARGLARVSPTSVPRALVALVALVALGCGGGAGRDGLDFEVTEPGPYGVGYRTLQLTYTVADGRPARTIPVSVWYPVEPGAAARLEGVGEHPQYLIVPSEVAFVDAPLAAPAYEGGFPLLIHSHGHFGYSTQSFILAEGLAAHGWVVVIPSHVGDTIQDVNKDPYLASWYERPLDITKTLDLLENLPASDPLAGRIVTEHVLLSGHSRGTNTVWALLGADFDPAAVSARCGTTEFDAGGGCPAAQVAVFDQTFRDTRIVAGMPMAGNGDPTWFGGYAAMNQVATPVFMMSGTDDSVGDDAVFAQVTTPDVRWIELVGGCHNLFGSGACPMVSDAVAQPAIRTYALAFGRRHVLGDVNPTVLGILDGTTTVNTDVVIYHTR